METRLSQMHYQAVHRAALLSAYQLPKKHILVSGSSGLIGSELISFLRQAGHEVISLKRGEGSSSNETIYWHPEEGSIEPALLEGFDAVIHLAGENIAHYWTEQRKAKLFSSRCRDSWLLAEALLRTQRPPKVWIGASALGIYGDRGDHEVTEVSSIGPEDEFLVMLCSQWERASQILKQRGIRVVHARLGAVLSSTGGMLAKLLPAFYCGMGGRWGTGQQWVSWIALEDVIGALIHILAKQEIAGPVHFCSPHPVRQVEFANILAKQIHRPCLGNLPAWAVGLLFGEMGKKMLLAGVCAKPAILETSGYSFLLPTLSSCFQFYLQK